MMPEELRGSRMYIEVSMDHPLMKMIAETMKIADGDPPIYERLDAKLLIATHNGIGLTLAFEFNGMRDIGDDRYGPLMVRTGWDPAVIENANMTAYVIQDHRHKP